MSRRTSVGIDIGTYHVKVAVSEAITPKERLAPRLLGVGISESRGLRHGYIVNKSDVTKCLVSAIRQAERSSGLKIRRAQLALGGIGLAGTVSQGFTMITRADSEITELDVERAILAAENEIPKPLITNRRIIHTIPIQYRVDSRPSLGRPEGLKGSKLEARVHFITALSHHVNDLVEAVEDVGVEVEDVVAAPIAASLVTLTKLQKIAGVVLANIGAETVSIAIFENGLPVSLEVFPIGSGDITNDIALGLKIPLDEAERVKTTPLAESRHPRKKLEEIVGARLSDIFELIESHLKRIGRAGLLPAGIVITGGGSGLGDIDEFAKYSLKLPSRVATFNLNLNAKNNIRDATWAVAYGLTIVALSGGDEVSGLKIAKTAGSRLIAWLKQFLP